jgi:hypothetical protein
VGGAGIQLQPTARGLGWRQAQPSEMFLDVVFLQDFETLFGDSVMVLELGSANVQTTESLFGDFGQETSGYRWGLGGNQQFFGGVSSILIGNMLI